MIPSAMILSAAGLVMVSNIDAIWCAGYASALSHDCPGFEQDVEAIARDGGMPIGIDDDVHEADRASQAFHAGGKTMEKALEADPAFCTHPYDSAGDRAATVRRYVRQVGHT